MKLFGKITAAAVSIVTAFSMSACSNNETDKKSDKINIICTTFSEYDWTREIVGNNSDIEITYLLDDGVDLHNYQPNAEDMLKISSCDMFVYVGGESDKWVNDALNEAVNKDMKVVSLLDVLGNSAKEEEVKEGMEAEDEAEPEDDGIEYDEHVWLSVKNAEICCDAICDAVCELDPSASESYKSSLSDYKAQLDSLDKDYTEMADSAKIKTLLFGDRFPFRYLVDDYGIDYYAAFVGCSAETEASFETIVGLAKKLDDNDIDTVFKIENSDDSLAKAIIENSSDKNRGIESLNSIQSVTADMVNSGISYISIMRDNLETLRKVLC